MNNYRMVIPVGPCNYWSRGKRQAESDPSFGDIHAEYYPWVWKIRRVAKLLGIKYIWCFYEPHVEITWLSTPEQAEELANTIRDVSNNYNLPMSTPQQGSFAEWFCKNDKEGEFGAKRYGVCADLVALFEEYSLDIDEFGKGTKEQVKRTIHAICNPLGLNYMDEAYICFSRGLICLLFRFFSFKKAVWIYTKIFRQKY